MRWRWVPGLLCAMMAWVGVAPLRVEALTASIPGQALLAATEVTGQTGAVPAASSKKGKSRSKAKSKAKASSAQGASGSGQAVASAARNSAAQVAGREVSSGATTVPTAVSGVTNAGAVAPKSASSEQTNLVWVAPLTPTALSVASEAPPPAPTAAVSGTNDVVAAARDGTSTNQVVAAPEPIEVGAREVILSMTDLMGVALDESPDVMLEKLPMERAEAWLKLQRSTFEPRFAGGVTYSQSDRIQNYWDYSYLRPAEKFLRLDQMRTKRYTGGVTGKLPIGTQVSVDVDYVDTDSSQWDRVNSLGQYIYPYRETSDGRAGVTLTQPLLRGFGPPANLSEIRVARASLAAADIAWRQSLARRLAGIARAYIDLYAAYDDMDMVRQLEMKVRDAVAKGEAQAADVQQWVDAREAAAKKIDTLQKQLIRQTREREQWWKDQPEYWVRPLELQPAACPVVPQNDQLMAIVMESPDYQTAKSGVEQAWHRLRKAKNDLLPKVDVFGKVGVAGFGEDTDAVWRDMEDQNRTDWAMGVKVEVGLGGDIGAQAKRDQYDVDYRKAEESIKNLEFDLREQIKGAFEACTDAFSAYEKARDSRRAAESYAVDRPEYYRTLRQAEIRSLGLYERAIITLELLEGKFPERYGVRFVEKGEVSTGLAAGNAKGK